MNYSENNYSLLLCEDQEEYADELRDDLDDYFKIDICSNLEGLVPRLEELQSKNQMPNILLLDLYWKKHKQISDEERSKISKLVDDFRQYINDFKNNVSDVLAPHGLMYLSLIREKFSAATLPIMMYTRAGPFTLDGFQIEQIYENNANFLIKYYDPALKNYLIRRFIERERLTIDAFISYSSKDRLIAEEMKSRLEKQHLNVFMSEKTIKAGDTWTNVVKNAITSAKVVVVIVTPNSIDSEWVMAEAGAGWALGKTVIPAIMLVDTGNVPLIISQFQMTRCETEHQKVQLVKEICKRIHNV